MQLKAKYKTRKKERKKKLFRKKLWCLKALWKYMTAAISCENAWMVLLYNGVHFASHSISALIRNRDRLDIWVFSLKRKKIPEGLRRYAPAKDLPYWHLTFNIWYLTFNIWHSAFNIQFLQHQLDWFCSSDLGWLL